MRSSTCGQIEVRATSPAAGPDRSPVGWPSSARSGTGMTTSSSICFDAGGCTMVTGRPPVRNRPTSSSGRTVAESPIRCAGRSSSASSRASETARCAPRFVPTTAWTSSTITVWTPLSISRARLVRIRNSDSGRGDQDVRTVPAELPPVLGRRVAGPHRHRDLRRCLAAELRLHRDAGERGPQVSLDVDRQRLERGEVQDSASLGRPPGRRGRLLDDEPVDGGQERRKRLAGAGRRHHQGVRDRGGSPARHRAGPASGPRTTGRTNPTPARRSRARAASPPRTGGGPVSGMRSLSTCAPTVGSPVAGRRSPVAGRRSPVAGRRSPESAVWPTGVVLEAIGSFAFSLLGSTSGG